MTISPAALFANFASSFGGLNQDNVNLLDEGTKVTIAHALNILGNIPAEERSWKRVASVLNDDILLESVKEETIDRTDAFVKDDLHVFKFDGSPDASIVQEVYAWFTKLIGDPEVLQTTHIDIGAIANVVAQTGATAVDFSSFFHKEEKHEKTVAYVSIVQYPDPTHPYLKIYSIKLNAWSQSERWLVVQEDKMGITGEYKVRAFKPNYPVISALPSDRKRKYIKQTEQLFSD